MQTLGKPWLTRSRGAAEPRITNALAKWSIGALEHWRMARRPSLVFLRGLRAFYEKGSFVKARRGGPCRSELAEASLYHSSIRTRTSGARGARCMLGSV
jgi:hypothetical protein